MTNRVDSSIEEEASTESMDNIVPLSLGVALCLLALMGVRELFNEIGV